MQCSLWVHMKKKSQQLKLEWLLASMSVNNFKGTCHSCHKRDSKTISAPLRQASWPRRLRMVILAKTQAISSTKKGTALTQALFPRFSMTGKAGVTKTFKMAQGKKWFNHYLLKKSQIHKILLSLKRSKLTCCLTKPRIPETTRVSVSS